MQLSLSLIAALALLQAGAPQKGADTLPRGENLVVQNVPEIPLELAGRLQQYQNMRSASLQAWLPGDEGMLITTRFAQTAQVHHVPFAGGRRTQLTFFGEKVDQALVPPVEGARYLLLSMDVGGNEAYQLYRFERDTGRRHLLTDGKSRNEHPIFAKKSAQVAFASSMRNGRDYDLYLLDLSKPDAKPVRFCENEGMWLPLDFSPDGKELIALHYVSINDSRLHLIDVATGEKRPFTPHGKALVSNPSARYSPDGKRIYFTTDRDHDFVRLAYVERGAKAFKPKYLTSAISWDVEEFELSDDGALIAFTTNENGASILHVTDPEGKPVGAQAQLPLGMVGGLKFKRGGETIGFGFTGPRTSGDVYSFEPRKGTLTRWTYSETGGLDASTFAEPTLFTYPSFDKVEGKPRQIPAMLFMPPARFTGPRPVIINVHGGPEGQSRPRFLGAGNYRMEEQGAAVIYPNVRGSAGYGKRFLMLDNGFKREDSVRDIGALLDWIATRPELDKSRIAVMGGSYGGYMSLASLTHYSDKLRCGISYVGISNFVTFLKNTMPYRQDLRRVEYGDERDPKMLAFLEKISPLTRVEKIGVPLFVVQGANDPRVPASESDQIVEGVKKRGGEVWYLLAKDEGHGFAKKANADYMDLATILFFDKYLLGQDEAAPATAR